MKTYLALAIAIIGLGLTSWALWERSQGLKLERDNALGRVAGLEQAIKDRDEQIAIESLNRIAYYEALRAAQNENDRLVSELAVKPQRVFVRGTCPAVPEAESARGTTGTSCELDAETRLAVRRVEQNFLLLRRDVGRVEAWINFCHKTILAWGE